MAKRGASGRTEEALIEAGRAVILEDGFMGLSLRKVAARAGVNLGMFPYLFGTKEAFARRVAQRIYDDFFGGFALETSRRDTPVANLRRGMIRLGIFARDHRTLALSFMRDASAGHALTREFLLANGPRHANVLIRLIRAAQKSGSLARVPVPVALAHLMGSIVAPNIVLAAAERAGLPLRLRVLKPYLDRVLLSDRAIAQRVGLALAGLAPGAATA